MTGEYEERLRAYVYERLPADEEREVRRWLMTVTDVDVLETYSELIAQRRRREEQLSYWLSHPTLAKLDRVWKTRLRPLWSDLSFELDPGEGAPALAGGRLSQATTRESRLILEAPIGEEFELVLNLEHAAYVAVFAIVDGEEFHVLRTLDSKSDAGPLELQTVTLESESDRIEFIGLLDRNSPVPQPATDAGVEWLFELLDDWADAGDGRSVVRASLAPTAGDTPPFDG